MKDLLNDNTYLAEYPFAVANIQLLKNARMKKGITVKELSLLSGVSIRSIFLYEKGRSRATIGNYNALAKIFGWQLVPEQNEKRLISRCFSTVPLLDDEPAPLPKNPEFSFLEGHLYCSSEQGSGDFIFRYEGKKGIHHFFTEIHGNWTRTYTDAQLVDKHIKELNT